MNIDSKTPPASQGTNTASYFHDPTNFDHKKKETHLAPLLSHPSCCRYLLIPSLSLAILVGYYISTMNTPCYYDIDDILAQEELIPCTTLFDFSHLAQLDPDARHEKHYLPEGSRIKLPLWAMEKWAMLGFVRLSLPRHYGRKARERLEADPADADLRYVLERGMERVTSFYCISFCPHT
jgi:hypothetical protein